MNANARSLLRLGATAAALALALACGGGRAGVAPTTAAVERDALEVTVETRGDLEAEKAETVRAPRFAWGNLTLKLVDLLPEGTEVTPGEVVASLDKDEMRRFLRDAESDLKRARADVAKAEKALNIERARVAAAEARLRAELEIRELQLIYFESLPGLTEAVDADADLRKALKSEEIAIKEFEPVRDLADRGFESRARLAEKRLERDIAVVESALKRLEYEHVMAGATAEELVAARLDVEQARAELDKAVAEREHKVRQGELAADEAAARLDRARFELARTTESIQRADLLSPSTGVVTYSRVWQGQGLEKIKEGMTVRPHWKLLRVEDMSSMMIEVEVEESQIALVREGLPARIEIDAIPGETFRGEVFEIGSVARDKSEKKGGQWWRGKKEPSGVRVFDVKVRLDVADPRFRPGFNGEVTIVAETIEDALSVPVDALFHDGDREFVYLRSGNEWIERTVEAGRRARGRVVVEEGLEEDDVVRLGDPDGGGES